MVTYWQPMLPVLTRQPLLIFLILSMLWAGVWEAGRLLEVGAHASVWYPPAGLSIALFFLIGRYGIIPVVIGVTYATFRAVNLYQIELAFEQVLIASAMSAVFHILPYYLLARYLRALRRQEMGFYANFILNVLSWVPIATLVASIGGLYSLAWSGMMPAEQIGPSLLPFWIGDLAAALALGPVFIGLLSVIVPASMHRLPDTNLQPSKPFNTTSMRRLLLLMLFLLAALYLAAWSDNQHSVYAIFFMVVPHMWIATIEKPFNSAIAVTMSSIIIAIFVPLLGLAEYVLVYQFAICVIAANAIFGLALPALMQHNRKMQQLLETDSLTQAASRDHLINKANAQLARCAVQGVPVSIVVFDIDRFKQINDQYGHGFGDEALSEVARAAQSCLRPCDLLGRFGGDEFVAVLPGASLTQSKEICERIRAAITQLQFRHPVSVSASFGIAQSHHETSFAPLFERADHALYEAKALGRNRVVTQLLPAVS